MHTNVILPARKLFAGIVAGLLVALFTGCASLTLTNLTPPALPANPSAIYTFMLRVNLRSSSIPANSVAAHVIVDGKSFDMHQGALGEGIYEFEYQVPSGREELAYDYLVTYQVEGNNGRVPAEAFTAVTNAKIVSRYVLSLETNRGPVGARISLLGRGFTAQDGVNFGETPARTVYESPNALSFYVPALESGRNYELTLNSPAGNSPIGPFRIDSSTLAVSPSSLSLRQGESQAISFTVPNAAPPGGLLLDVTTDVPESVIMPEVIVPQGQMSVTVNVQGGKPGSGSLFLKGYGSGEVTVPVTVSAR